MSGCRCFGVGCFVGVWERKGVGRNVYLCFLSLFLIVTNVVYPNNIKLLL